MNDLLEQSMPRPDVVAALRERAAEGATAHELATEVRVRLGSTEDAVLPVLWYFMEAFHLSLSDVLPLREDLGAGAGRSSDELLRPLIQRTRGQWLSASTDARNGVGGTSRAQDGAATRRGD